MKDIHFLAASMEKEFYKDKEKSRELSSRDFPYYIMEVKQK